MVTTSPRNLLIAAVLVSAIVGSATGLTTNYLMKTSQAPQIRTFYLFARDLSFNTTSSGLSSDCVYSTDYIVVNKGDTLVIHFFNPTDQHHSFTMESPYANNVTVAGALTDQSPPHSVTITITANQAGSFLYHCLFHSPQMAGTILVQG